MADESAGEKTIPASPLRRQRAREEGKVAKSQDLAASIALLAALFALRYLGLPVFDRLLAALRYYLAEADHLLPELGNVQAMTIQAIGFAAPALAPFVLILMLVGVLVNIIQIGLLFTGKPLIPKWRKLNVFAGIRNLFSLNAGVELLKSIFKVAVAAYIVWITFRGRLDELVNMMELAPPALLPAAGALVFMLWWRIVLAMLVIGLLDYGFQYWQYERGLMMTVQEAKEELKEYEGDPRIKQRIRQIQRRIAMQRMMAEVPKAEVIVTNPTRFAVALRYDAAKMHAPVVVAKGARYQAERIRDLAVEHDVPIVQNPELARTLYRTVDIGQPIPEHLFRAVAQVLAYVYRIDWRVEKMRERGMGAAQAQRAA